MNDAPSALLRIPRLPEGVIALLHELADSGCDLVGLTLDLLHRDKTWLDEVAAFFPDCRLNRESQPLAAFHHLGITEMAIATGVRRYIRIEPFSPELKRYWRYSLACGLACAELSSCTHLKTPLAFSCGLLHDLGRWALITAYPAQYANLFATSQRLCCNELFNVSEQESLLFGFDRFQTGEWLVDQWGLPELFKQIVGRFQVTPTADVDLIALTRAGCSMAYAFGYGLLLGAPQRSSEDLLSVLPLCVIDGAAPDLHKLKDAIDETLDEWPTPVVNVI